jgi:hypothetical protein
MVRRTGCSSACPLAEFGGKNLPSVRPRQRSRLADRIFLEGSAACKGPSVAMRNENSWSPDFRYLSAVS